MFRKKLKEMVRDRLVTVVGRLATNHVWDAVGYRVYVIAVWAGHLALLYVDLVGTMSNEMKRMMN